MGNQRHHVQQQQAAKETIPVKKAIHVEKPSGKLYHNQPHQSLKKTGSSHAFPLNSESILALQRTIGNQAVSRIIQAKLKISQPGDLYEQEADRVANMVVKHTSAFDSNPYGGSGFQQSQSRAAMPVQIVPSISRFLPRTQLDSLHRQNDEEEKEETGVSLKSNEEEKKELQVKLEKTEPVRVSTNQQEKVKLQSEKGAERQTLTQRQGDEEEEVQTQLQPSREETKEEPQHLLQRQEEVTEEIQTWIDRQAGDEEIQVNLQAQGDEEELPAIAQRQNEEEEEVQTKAEPRPNLQKKRLFQGIDWVEKNLLQTKGKGEPLKEETRIGMEASFFADFRSVRIHSDQDAAEMSRELKAQAFTHGKDIFFNFGKYEPQSIRGRFLLAHELTHVVQQGAAEQKLNETSFRHNTAARSQATTGAIEEKEIGAPELSVEKRIQEKGAGARDKEANLLNPPPSTQADATKGSFAPRKAEPNFSGPEAAAPEESAVETAPQNGNAEAKNAEKAPAAEASHQPKRKTGAEALPYKEVMAEEQEAEGGAVPNARAKSEVGSVGEFLRRTTKAVFEAKKAGIAKLGKAQKTKNPAEAKLAQTEKAVIPPLKEGESRAKAGQVEKVDNAKPPRPDEREARARLDSALRNAIPATLEEVDRFKEEGKGRLVGQAVREVVTADTQEVKGTYQKIENPPPAPAPGEKAEALPEVETAPETPPVKMGEGVVGEVQPEHTDMSEFSKQSDELLKKEEIKEEYLEMVDEGDLAEAKKDRQTVKTKVKEASGEVKQAEQEEKQKVSKGLQKEEQESKQLMREVRRKELHGARDDQKKTKSKIELKRQAVTDRINGVYEKANATVKQKLDDLEKKSLSEFDEGQKRVTQSFEDNVKRRINAFKIRRYDRFGGSALWLKDKVLGMDDLPEVKEICDSEKARFVSAIDGLIKNITAENKRVVQECRDIVANARKEIDKYVQSLGPDIKKAGQEALNAMRGKLEALDQGISAKEEALKKKLAEKRETAIKAIEDKIAKMKEEMSGLVSKLGKLLLNAMLKFFEWALKKAGYASDQLMRIINKGKEIIRKIVTDPIGFIKNLVKAVKDGLELFWANIKKHLIAGLMSWLTGAMADVPISLPDKWDLKGILHLILQVLGLTWNAIRTKLVKRLGEKLVRIAETSVDIVKRLIAEGPMGLWEMLQEKAEEIKEQVMEGIRNWAMFELVKQGIIKLVSFLNPAGAIIQAILAIYNTIMFFVENWERIVEFVKTVFNSIGDIAMGKLSAAAKAVERALGMTVSIILAFLARLLGLSGIGKTVAGIIKKVRKPIDKVVNKVIDSVVKLAKKLAGKVKAGAKVVKEKLITLLRLRHKFSTPEGKKHTLFFRGKGAATKVQLTSSPEHVSTFLKRKKDEITSPTSMLSVDEKRRLNAHIADAEALLSQIEGLTYPPEPNNPVPVALQRQVNTLFKRLAHSIKRIDITATPIPPLSIVPGFSSNQAKGLRVQHLVKGHHKPGSEASDYSGDLHGAAVILRSLNVRAKWVAFHLLNAKTGGKAVDSNLIPTPQDVNKNFKAFETPWKNRYAKGETLWMEATVSYLDEYFPKHITVEGGAMKMNRPKRVWEPDSTQNIPKWSKDIARAEPLSILINQLPADDRQRGYVASLTPIEKGLLIEIAENLPPYIRDKGTIINYIKRRFADDSARAERYVQQIKATNLDFRKD